MMLDQLDLTRIQQVVSTECDVSLFDCIDSTNEWALQQISKGRAMPFACFAEQQTQGRGRRGKHWVSPPGGNIYMSVARLFELPVNQLAWLPLAMGLGLIRVLEKAGIADVMLKWPNDVLVDGKKIAGILVEATKVSEDKTPMVIGVGLNYQLLATSSVIPDQPWTDVTSVLKHEPEGGRNYLAGQLLQECINVCEYFPQSPEVFMNEFQRYDGCVGNTVDVVLGSGEQFQGLALGVTSNGELRVFIEGEERVFNSADISLRNVNQGA